MSMRGDPRFQAAAGGAVLSEFRQLVLLTLKM